MLFPPFKKSQPPGDFAQTVGLNNHAPLWYPTSVSHMTSVLNYIFRVIYCQRRNLFLPWFPSLQYFAKIRFKVIHIFPKTMYEKAQNSQENNNLSYGSMNGKIVIAIPGNPKKSSQ